MARGASSNRWLQRQAKDKYVKQRDGHGYRSRAAYKLLELNQRERLIRPGSVVLDLGAAPGGWTQVAALAVGGAGKVVALDILEMQPVKGATVVLGDCLVPDVQSQLAEIFTANAVDLVMSDMAPNITGISARDEAAATELAETALTIAQQFLRPGGALLMKLFQSRETDAILSDVNRLFRTVVRRKPDASRAKSREFYVVAKQFGL